MTLTREQEDFIKTVYQDVSFYARKAEGAGINVAQMDLQRNWNRLPLVEKSEVISESDGMLMPECIPLWLSDRLFSVFTSGSTGMCLKVYWKKQDVLKSLFPLWIYRKKEFGILPQDKYCYFYATRSIGGFDNGVEEIKNQMGFSKNNLTEERIVEVYRQMCAYEPVWLLLQPAMAMLLVSAKKKFNLPDIGSLKYIEMSGEMLTEEVRREVETVFGCRTANQYGAYEINSIAYDCHEGNLHCMEENVIVEILDENGNSVPDGVEGDIYITSLQNRAMPFVRYKIGDRGYFRIERCQCGRTGKILCLTQTRMTEWVLTECGERINPYVLLRPIANINKCLDHPILQFQIIQKSISRFLYKVVAEEDMQQEICLQIPENICEKRLAGSRVEIVFCDRILPDEDTGKLKWFKNEVETETI